MLFYLHSKILFQIIHLELYQAIYMNHKFFDSCSLTKIQHLKSIFAKIVCLSLLKLIRKHALNSCYSFVPKKSILYKQYTFHFLNNAKNIYSVLLTYFLIPHLVLNLFLFHWKKYKLVLLN